MKIKYGLFYLLVVFVFAYGCKQNVKETPTLSDQALINLAALLSDSDETVVNDISLFVSNKNKYFKQHENDLFERGIEDPSQILPAVALVDSLLKAKDLVYQDNRSEAGWALKELDMLSNNTISNSRCYSDLEDYYRSTKYGIGTFLGIDGEWPSLFKCIESAGLKLLAVNEDSDAYALVLVQAKDLSVVLETAKESGISFYFAQK